MNYIYMSVFKELITLGIKDVLISVMYRTCHIGNSHFIHYTLGTTSTIVKISNLIWKDMIDYQMRCQRSSDHNHLSYHSMR